MLQETYLHMYMHTYIAYMRNKVISCRTHGIMLEAATTVSVHV